MIKKVSVVGALLLLTLVVWACGGRGARGVLEMAADASHNLGDSLGTMSDAAGSDASAQAPTTIVCDLTESWDDGSYVRTTSYAWVDGFDPLTTTQRRCRSTSDESSVSGRDCEDEDLCTNYLPAGEACSHRVGLLTRDGRPYVACGTTTRSRSDGELIVDDLAGYTTSLIR